MDPYPPPELTIREFKCPPEFRWEHPNRDQSVERVPGSSVFRSPTKSIDVDPVGKDRCHLGWAVPTGRCSDKYVCPTMEQVTAQILTFFDM